MGVATNRQGADARAGEMRPARDPGHDQQWYVLNNPRPAATVKSADIVNEVRIEASLGRDLHGPDELLVPRGVDQRAIADLEAGTAALRASKPFPSVTYEPVLCEPVLADTKALD